MTNNTRAPRLPLPERFWFQVQIGEADDCWPWTGPLQPDGYARFRGPGGKAVGVHRYSYALAYGPVPEGHQVDHLCHDPSACTLLDDCPHRHCMNPAHLRATTPQENTRRSSSPSGINAAKTHCDSGHPFDETNTYIHATSGQRCCRICTRKYQAEYNKRRRAKALLSN